jgi:hypothetical protein
MQFGLRQRVGVVRIGVRDQFQGAGEVVEYQHVFRHHQQDVRRAEFIGRTAVGKFFLDITHGVVAEIPDQATREYRQAIDRRHAKTLLKRFDEGQRIDHPQMLFEHRAVAIQANLMAIDLQHITRGQADDGVAPPLFAAMNGFE